MRLRKAEILADDELDAIYLTALSILKDVGVQVLHDETLKLLRENGCEVGENRLVFFPEGIVKECLNAKPSRVTLCGRDPEKDMNLGRGTWSYTGAILEPYVQEYPKRTFRTSTMKDVEKYTRILDYYDCVDWLHPAWASMDYGKWNAYATYEANVCNTSKHCWVSPSDPAVIDPICELASAMVGGREELSKRAIVSAGYAAVCPLIWNWDGCEVFKKTAQYGMPTMIFAEDMMGVTGPVTLAGNLAQKVAEFLSGNVILQLRNRGLPVIFGTVDQSFDMLTGQVSYGSPANFVMKLAFGQIGRYLDVPTWNYGLPDSHILDVQYAYEQSYGFLSAMLAGVDLVCGGTAGGAGWVTPIEGLPLLEEMVLSSRQMLEGIEVSPDTLALDLIKRTSARFEKGLRTVDYLSQAHTREWYKRKNPLRKYSVMTRTRRETWIKEGSKSYSERAHEIIEKILATHKPPALPEGIPKRIAEIRKKYGIAVEERTT